MNILKSKTMWFSFAVAILGVLEESSGIVAEVVGQQHLGAVMLGISVISAGLRVMTTQPLSEK